MPIVTISRGILSGGEQLAKNIGDKLNYPVVSRKLLLKTTKKYGVTEDELLEGLEKPASFWERLTHHKDHYILAAEAILSEMLEEGNGI